MLPRVTSYDGDGPGEIPVHQLKNGYRLTVSIARSLRDQSRIFFRGKHVAKAGNFSRWNDVNDFFGHPEVGGAFKRIIGEFIDADSVKRVLRFTIIFSEVVGWSRTIAQDRLPAPDTELREINSDAEGFFVTDKTIGAPMTNSVNVVCKMSRDGNLWKAVVCMVSPGPTPGELKGNVSIREEILFFDLDHPGSTSLIFN
jgi:hypothetical protein